MLIFSQSVATLDILQDFLAYKRYTYERLDGSVRARCYHAALLAAPQVRGDDRFKAIDRFSSEVSSLQRPRTARCADACVQETFVFLLSTRAGGTGLNLTMADSVIFIDQDWCVRSRRTVHRLTSAQMAVTGTRKWTCRRPDACIASARRKMC